MFSTVLHHLKSPENAGILVRTRVALGGAQIVIVGPEPWRFKRRFETFSRRLERLSELVHCPDDDAFFAWCAATRVEPVAIEIASPPQFLPDFPFPARAALVVGHEGAGLPPRFLGRCRAVLTIPQHGPAACLNTAVAGCIAMYELVRRQPSRRPISVDEYVIHEVGERPGA